jgi:dienelactone hydrolase
MRFPKREWPIRRLLPLVFCYAVAAAAVAGCRVGQSPERVLSFDSADGVTIHATVYTPSAKAGPGLILLHQAGSTRESWAAFARMARADGYFSIAIDLRGHGQSTTTPGHTNPSAFTQNEWLAVLKDIPQAKQKLIEAGADPDKLAIMGASIGANLALRYAASDPQVQAAVLLSPGEEYNGVSIVHTVQTYSARPILLMATQSDGFSARSAKKLDDLAPEYTELRLYPGAAHGADLLTAVPVAPEQVIMWLDHILGHTPPA